MLKGIGSEFTNYSLCQESKCIKKFVFRSCVGFVLFCWCFSEVQMLTFQCKERELCSYSQPASIQQ